MENGETDEQAPYLKLTTTNDQYQLTHSLKPVEGQKSIEMDSKTILRKNLSNLQARADDPIYIRTGTDGVAGQWRLTELDPRGQKAKPKWWRPDDRKKIHLTLPSNAYWVFEAPKEILSGHGGSPTQGVITNQMLDLLLAMIARANLPDRADGGPTVKIDLDSTGSSRPLE